MDSPHSSGRPAISYTNALPPGSGEQSPSAPGVSETGSLYTLCPALHWRRQHQPETGSLPQRADDPSQQHHPSQTCGCASRDPMTYYHPHQPRSQDDWLLPAVDTKNVTDISIPKPAPADAFNYNPSPVSSGNWPSPAQPFRQSVDLVPHSTLQNHQDCTQIGTPTSIDDYQMNDCEARPPYASGANLSYTGSSTMHRPHQPSPISLPSSYSPVPRLSASGSPKVTLGEPPHQMPSLKVEAHDPVVPSLPGSRDSSTGPKKSAESSASKKDEPYAKLIEKALRSRADYSMQLQEIYQWFLENTDKARSFQSQPKDSVGKGWQNSIRHNLSMNAAFTKKDDERPGHGSSAASEHKRSTVWVLAPWAIKEGVQSTTRYRKMHATRKAMPRSASQPFSQPFSHNIRTNSMRPFSGIPFDGGAGRMPSQPYDHRVPMTPVTSSGLPQTSFLAPTFPRLPYPSGPHGIPRVDTVPQNPYRQDQDNQYCQAPRSNPDFSTSMRQPSMGDGVTTSRSSPTGSYPITHGLPVGPISFGIPPQTTFPYSVQDVHVNYPCGSNPTTPSSTPIFENEPHGFSGFNNGEM